MKIRRTLLGLGITACAGFLGRAVAWKMEAWNMDTVACFVSAGVVAIVMWWYYTRRLKWLCQLFDFDEAKNLCVVAKGEEFKVADSGSDLAEIVETYKKRGKGVDCRS